MTKKNWQLSASLFGAFKACATRCNLKYVYGLVPVEDTDSQRTGTNWHRILEIAKMKPGSVCPDCSKKQKNPDCPLCQGTDFLPEDIMDAVIRHLNQAYAEVPLLKTRDEWLTERAILLYSLCGYRWHYSEDNYEVVAEELKFRLPLRNPATGRALPNVVVQGKIDKIVRGLNGICCIDEHKSTSKSLDPDSTYWNHLNLDTQTRLYPWAARQMQLNGDLEPYGIKPTDPLISMVRFDAWHKPQIRPKKLTQADSNKFVEDGLYLGDQFSIEIISGPMNLPSGGLKVNNEPAEVTPGKKEGTFAVRETPEMFGTRLLKEIAENPEKYFARRELSRTADDMKQLEYEMVNIYHTIKFMDRNGAWWKNEQQCEATFKCPYIPVCYNNVDVSNGIVPDGFKCILKDKK